MTSEEIKDSISMEDVLAMYGLPKPNRAGFICCPFHKEHTPSMKIYPKDYHCFGCGANGDVFSFVRQYEGISFKEAFLRLGGTYENHAENSFAEKRRKYQLAMKRRTLEKQRAENERTKRELREEIKMLYWHIRLFPPLSEEWCEAYNRFEYALYHLEYLMTKR